MLDNINRNPDLPSPPLPSGVNTAVLLTLVSVIVVDTIAVLILVLFAPSSAPTILPVMLAVSALVIPALLAQINANAAKQGIEVTHATINERMGEMLAMARQLATLQATLAEKGAQSDRESAIAGLSDTSSTTTTTTTLTSPSDHSGSVVFPEPSVITENFVPEPDPGELASTLVHDAHLEPAPDHK